MPAVCIVLVWEDIILPPFLLRWHTLSTVEAPGSVVGEGLAPPAFLRRGGFHIRPPTAI